MTEHITRARLLTVIEGDEGLYIRLRDTGLVPADESAMLPEHLELARVAHTLISELEVNWEGVEVVLRLRQELIASRRQMAALLRMLNKRA